MSLIIDQLQRKFASILRINSFKSIKLLFGYEQTNFFIAPTKKFVYVNRDLFNSIEFSLNVVIFAIVKIQSTATLCEKKHMQVFFVAEYTQTGIIALISTTPNFTNKFFNYMHIISLYIRAS